VSRKKPFTLRSLGREEAAQANANFDTLYRAKMESLLFHDPVASATVIMPVQVQELGKIYVSANGSPTIVKSIPLRGSYSDLLYAEANSQRVGTIVTVTDLTATSITIEAQVVSSTGNFSAVTTASVGVFWKVVGSTP
jgi:hypothetical protein